MTWHEKYREVNIKKRDVSIKLETLKLILAFFVFCSTYIFLYPEAITMESLYPEQSEVVCEVWYSNPNAEFTATETTLQVEEPVQTETSAEMEQPSLQPKNENNDELQPTINSEKKPAYNNDKMMKYASLYELNSDIIGWVKIENTNINYPVMQTKNDEEFYLRRNFEKQETTSGTPFLSANSNIDIESTQEIVYGHNMRNDTMFADLLLYKDEEFFSENQIVTFDTLYKERRYEIFTAFSIDVAKNNKHFPFYIHTKFNSEKSFTDFFSEITKLSWYNIENPPVYQDNILTLVTCDSYNNTQRFVVMAKLIRD